MAIKFPTPTELGDQYLTILKSLKPEVDISRQDSDWWIRSRVIGGLMSGMYADQLKISLDAFPQSARREALERHLDLYFGSGFIQATNAVGSIGVTGTNGSLVPAGTEFLYSPNGNTYQSTAAVTLVGTTGSIPVQSVAAGQDQNLLSGAALTIPSPPSGINSGAVALTAISDGRDVETNEQAAERILNRIQQPPAGGTANDYATWAKEADPSVTEANVIRFIYGLGTVGVVITAGTTDIDTAVTNGDPVVRVPSAPLIAKVKDYIDAKNPLTDCVFVEAPQVVYVPVTIRVRYLEGDDNTVPAGQTLTQKELVQREVRRAIYKTPPGGRLFGSTGYVVASEIEEVVDQGLSANPYTVGNFAQIIVDRQVENLAPSGVNLMLSPRQIAEPGTVSVVSF